MGKFYNMIGSTENFGIKKCIWNNNGIQLLYTPGSSFGLDDSPPVCHIYTLLRMIIVFVFEPFK